jgi:two-component system response regulator PilR (NtrC family)
VPALRERTEDITLLVEHILQRLSSHGASEVPRLTESALAALRRYPFPGNVRELENILERAMTLCEQGTIREEDLQLIQSDSPAPAAVAELPLEPYLGNIEKETILRALEQSRHNKTAAARLLGISFGALRYRLKKLGLE